MNEKIKKQFDEMKAKHPNVLLLFSTGDFFEAYGEDATVVADLLGIIITDKGGEKVAAFPHHALNQYLPKIVRADKRVAICDQLDAPQPLVKRVSTEATESQTSNSPTMAEVKNLPTWGIKPSPMNPRKTFDEGAIAELAASIKQHGLLQPITVRPKDGLYEIVMGERRYRAMKSNNAEVIPCIVREMTDEEALDAMITENLQRKDVDPIEEAFAFGQLLKTGKTIEQIADRFGKSKRFIQERIKLDNLLPELKSWVTKEWMTIGAAMYICKLTEDEQRQFFENFAEDANEECVGDPINKQDAIDFTDDLFMRIENAIWKRDFSGSCGTTCEKCPFNNANVGCLFYEMKPHDATCTNRAKWDAKRFSWLQHLVDENAASLIKEGGSLEAGKTLLIADGGYYAERCSDYEPLLEYIRGKGIKIAKHEDYFERFSHYREDDERLREKLANNEVYRCLCVEAGYRGTEVHVRYFEFKKSTEEAGDEVQAMNLVNEYKENERKNIANTAFKLRGILGDIEPAELPTAPLTQTESLVLMTLILRECSYKFRSALDVNFTYGSGPKAFNYAKNHPEQAHQICRDFLREELSSSGVEYNADLQECQRLLLDEWAREATDEVVNDMALKLAKKQSKIVDQLTKLGYNVDGSKMDF